MKWIVSIPCILILGTALCYAAIKPSQLVASARRQIGVTLSYDPVYRQLDYPGGDVPKNTGVCSDVVVRAFREQETDLQKEVHEDMRRSFGVYPQKWNLKKPDRNIDHRRVLNLMTYFERQGFAQSITNNAENFAAGDIVAWDLGGGVTHIGIVSDHTTTKRVPLIIHNIGRGTQEEDILLRYRVIGHYRLK
jgi:uncharacterized protein